MPEPDERQLELFDGTQPSLRPRHRETLGRVLLQVRHDQLVLLGIAGLIGVTVIFASGVERGKQLARSERALIGREPLAAAAKSIKTSTPSVAGQPATVVAPATAPSSGAASSATPLTPLTPKPKAPSKPASGKSRYAVQVVTYSRPKLAKLELERLKAKGESAFLIIREGRTSVYIGPFSTKGNAQEQVARLKARYQDCFVKSL
jgi:hypothetical protein